MIEEKLKYKDIKDLNLKWKPEPEMKRKTGIDDNGSFDGTYDISAKMTGESDANDTSVQMTGESDANVTSAKMTGESDVNVTSAKMAGESDTDGQEHWRKRAETRRKQQEQRKRRLFLLYGIVGVVVIAGIITLAVILLAGVGEDKPDPRAISTENQTPGILDESRSGGEPSETEDTALSYEAHLTEETGGFAESVVSERGILIDVETGDILAQKGAYDRISPASMTKILTALVAAEHIMPEQLDDTFTMTIEITDYSYVNGCSNAGFEVGQEITVRDLFYGTMLPSGADAAVGLATYVAGSQEAFVELMNEKLAEMGLSETTHFTNCVGLYDEEHYSSVYDMALILKAATDNALCREVMSARKYTTSVTKQHEEGLIISNWFLRRIEDKDTHGEVLCAKTGFVNQSGSCAASLANDNSGKEYLCVTAGSTSSWRCIYDHVDIYTQYLPEA